MKSEHLFTRDQTTALLSRHGNYDLPKKGRELVIAFAKPEMPNIIIVSKTDLKSTYGKPLYRVVMGMDYEVFGI